MVVWSLPKEHVEHRQALIVRNPTCFALEVFLVLATLCLTTLANRNHFNILFIHSGAQPAINSENKIVSITI